MLTKVLKDEAGFTLIELLIVVVIIGILAAVGIPIYSRYITSAKASEAPTILGALVEYAGSYSRAHPDTWLDASTLMALDADDAAIGGTDVDGSSTDWVSEVVGGDNEYFNYVWNYTDATTDPTLTAAGPGGGEVFSTTDTMTVTFDADDGSVTGWAGAGRLADITPD